MLELRIRWQKKDENPVDGRAADALYERKDPMERWMSAATSPKLGHRRNR